MLNGQIGAKLSPFDLNDTKWIKKSHSFFCTRIKIFNKGRINLSHFFPENSAYSVTILSRLFSLKLHIQGNFYSFDMDKCLT